MMTMMATFLGEIDRHARECYDEGAGLTLRPLDPEADAPLLQRWFAMDYARFWSMQDHSVAQVRDFYAALCGSGHAQAWLGSHQGRPAFLVECYDPPTTKLASTTPCVRATSACTSSSVRPRNASRASAATSSPWSCASCSTGSTPPAWWSSRTPTTPRSMR